MEKSIDLDRFMTSESTEILILAFTSKTGQSVAHNSQSHIFFYFSAKEKIYEACSETIETHAF